MPLLMSGCKDSSNSPDAASLPSHDDPANAVVTTPKAGEAAASTDAGDADSRPLLVCFGDSLTAGYGTDAGESYPDQLQKLLNAKGYNYRVLNSGISGNTTKDGLDRIERVMVKHPKVVVVEFGGNDGLRGLPLEQTEANIGGMIERLQKDGATVALAGITLPPDYGKDYIEHLDAIYPALAKKYHVRLLPFLLQDVYGVSGDMQGDATHATAKGNKQVALNVEMLVLPLLKK
jgi:acyl-CoA thioesterase-1